jgi:hypothetical protein
LSRALFGPEVARLLRVFLEHQRLLNGGELPRNFIR